MAPPGSPAGSKPSSLYCSACFESRIDIPTISALVSEVFTTASANGGLYVMKTGTNEAIVDPVFANYALWRTLCNWDAIFASPGYRGDRYIDARVLALPRHPIVAPLFLAAQLIRRVLPVTMCGSQRNTIIAAVVVLAIIAVVVLAASTSRRRGDGFNSSFQFWTRDPAYGTPPLMNPYAPRSQLFAGTADNTRKANSLAGLSNPLQVSAAFTVSPADSMSNVDEDFRGPRRWRRRWGHQYAAPLWFAGPMSRYAWGNTPYFWNGPTPSYYGSFPYYATW